METRAFPLNKSEIGDDDCVYIYRTKCEYVSLEIETTAGQSISLEKKNKWKLLALATYIEWNRKQFKHRLFRPTDQNKYVHMRTNHKFRYLKKLNVQTTAERVPSAGRRILYNLQ